MLTGTPLDLTPFGPLLSALGLLYWAVALGAAGLALWLPRSWWAKLSTAAFVVAAFVYPVMSHVHTRQTQRDERQARLEESMALFRERCKGAGEKIMRTVDNVDSVVWMKWREKVSNADNFADQFKLNDPYGQDCGAEDCISNLLRVTAGKSLNLEEARQHSVGYRYVETADPKDGLRYRYVARIEQGWNQEAIARHKKETNRDLPSYSYQFKMHSLPIDKFNARYGITWDDVSTREDRDHWIAGGSLKVIDLHTNEVIAERVGYMIDRGQGSQAGFRSPWAYAVQNACPEYPTEPNSSRHGRTLHETRDFASRVLKTTQGE